MMMKMRTDRFATPIICLGKWIVFFLLALAGGLVLGGCNDSSTATQSTTQTISLASYNPQIVPEDFVPKIDNPLLPMVPGTSFVFLGDSDGEAERIQVDVTHDTKMVMGVQTIVVRDRVWVDDELVEETFDWFAQDKLGNVWYFGEDSTEYEDGVAVSTEGSWEAGVDGAMPGIIMKAAPQIGDSYRQEYYAGKAEDMAEVISLTESVTVPYGSFDGLLATREWNPLEPGEEENKYYAPGIGVVLEQVVKGGSGRVELVAVTENN